MNLENLTRLRALLGEAVLLPVPTGEKGCKLAGWQRTAFKASTQRVHLRALLEAGNIGVLLGAASGHLITVDCDTDNGLEAFLDLNPTLRDTLITRGARGGNVWLRMAGEYPQRTQRLGVDGHWGEFRSGGAQTIIAGTHPDGHPYTMRHQAAPLAVAFDSLRWPSEAAPARGWHHGAPAPLEAARPRAVRSSRGEADAEGTQEKEGESSPLSLHLSTSLHALHLATSLHLAKENPHPRAEAIRVQQKFERDHPHLAKITSLLISRFLPLIEGERNTLLTCEIAPRLFGAMGPAAADTVLRYLIEGDLLGGYPPTEARDKFTSAWAALESEYAGTLSPAERECFHAIADARLQEAFRICRSLAALREPGVPAGCFYLACGALAERLGLPLRAGQRDCSAAAKVLKKLTQYHIVTLIDRGQQRKAGSRGRTATYRWNFPLPAATPRIPGRCQGEGKKRRRDRSRKRWTML